MFVAPGNAGTALEDRVENVAIKADSIEALADFASANAIELTIVGPEAPLVAGIVDTLTARGLKCFGPSAAAARLDRCTIAEEWTVEAGRAWWAAKGRALAATRRTGASPSVATLSRPVLRRAL